MYGRGDDKVSLFESDGPLPHSHTPRVYRGGSSFDLGVTQRDRGRGRRQGSTQYPDPFDGESKEDTRRVSVSQACRRRVWEEGMG